MESIKKRHSHDHGVSDGCIKLEVAEDVEDTSKQDEAKNKNLWVSTIEVMEEAMAKFWNSYGEKIRSMFKWLLLGLYLAYVSYSWYYRFGDEGSIILVVITSLMALRALFKFLEAKGVTDEVAKLLNKVYRELMKVQLLIKCFLYVSAIVGIGVYLAIQVFPGNPQNLQGLLGIGSLIVICFIFSTKPSRINWHPVFWGFVIQICVAIFTLRTVTGYSIFKWLGDSVRGFTEFADLGAAFVFGRDFRKWGLIFTASGLLVFFSAFLAMMVYLGVLDKVIRWGGRFVSACLGTGPVESVIAVCNIFLGQAEATLVIRPYLATLSLHRTLLTACSEGAVGSLKMIGAIMANMLAFYSLVGVMDFVIEWLGERVGISGLTFEEICGYLLYPVSYIMGVHPDDCRSVGALIGIKLFATPITGFIELGKLIDNREKFEKYVITNGTWYKSGKDIILEATNTTLVKGFMQVRSEVITTYAICGFSAFTAMAIGVGGYFALCPQRKEDVMKVLPYAFFAGNVACFATGAVAGLMYEDY
ncbi:solute carrier family 28 member 3-like [Plakobranchus ocellatus]|uniref:Solute carrier family 28 member 3-like n=1 Tax=Plakobranchus ocellatus TaxID=259542 RepID=A0AAV3YPV1_9GAST|nr:solute carrier family 28 member 3-like [Plakobranchus ocellatus]